MEKLNLLSTAGAVAVEDLLVRDIVLVLDLVLVGVVVQHFKNTQLVLGRPIP